MKTDKGYVLSAVRSAFFVLCFGLLIAGDADAQARDLGINAFIGQLSASRFQLWVDPSTGDQVRIDAYGKINTLFSLGLPTQLSGKVTALDLGDGTERVTVSIHARDAICWGFNGSLIPAFGYSPSAVRSGAGPAAIGDVSYRMVFAPQPVGQFHPVGAILDSFTATVMCDGLLRTGSGYPDGTDGFAQTTQTALFSTGVPSGCPPEGDADCFPAEKVQFKRNGN